MTVDGFASVCFCFAILYDDDDDGPGNGLVLVSAKRTSELVRRTVRMFSPTAGASSPLLTTELYWWNRVVQDVLVFSEANLSNVGVGMGIKGGVIWVGSRADILILFLGSEICCHSAMIGNKVRPLNDAVAVTTQQKKMLDML